MQFRDLVEPWATRCRGCLARPVTHPPSKCKKVGSFPKNSLFTVDGDFSEATLLTPPEAGLPTAKAGRSYVLAYFGTANWRSILSRLINPATRDFESEDRVGFFCELKYAKPLVL